MRATPPACRHCARQSRRRTIAAMVEQQLAELRERLKRSEDAERNTKSPLTIGGYADLGFFVPRGNGGAGWVRDAGNVQFPEYAGFAWTFLGDILATPVNTRGEAADLGEAPGRDRFDSVDSNGAAGFIVNELNLRLGYQLADRRSCAPASTSCPASGATSRWATSSRWTWPSWSTC